MKNFILCLVACCTFLLLDMNVDAATYTVPYPEPTVDGNHGYLILEFENGSIGTFFWGAGARSNSTTEFETYDTYMCIDVERNKVSFQLLTNTASSYMSYYLARYNTSHTFDIIKHGAIDTGNFTYSFETTNTITGYSFKGNVGRIQAGFETANTNPSFVFADNVEVSILYDILDVLSSSEDLMDTYLPKLNTILSKVQSLDTSVNNIESDVDYISVAMSDLYDLVDTILDDMNSNHAEIVEQNQAIYDELYDLKEQLVQNDHSMDSFEDSSDEQSSQLNDLNQNAQVEKPNIDDMDNAVEENLDVDIDANYGLLLSTFTTNNRILTMLLIVASVSLISYVFFGKR